VRIFKPKVMLITFFGTLLQWLEFASFGYLANIVAILYFPHTSKVAMDVGIGALMLTNYLAPLIGAFIFGYIGDAHGRKISLAVSIFLMGVASLTISFLPTYQQVGILASIMLLFCRFTQGVALAGEFNGACIFLMEHTSKKVTHLASCLPAVAAGAGLLLGNMYADAIHHTSYINWGWRLPFLLSAASCLLFSYLRLSIDESPAYLKALERSRIVKNPVLEVFKKHKQALVEGVLLSAFIIIYISVCGLFFFHYMISTAGIPYGEAISLSLIGNISLIILFPIMGYVSDLIGKQTLLTIGMIGACVCAPLMFMLASSQSIIILGFIQLFYAIFTASACAPLFGTLGRLFPSPVRYTGLSLSWSTSFALFAGTITQVLRYSHNTHHLMLPAAYATTAALIAFMVVLFPKARQYSVQGSLAL
jgi:MFS transporter, MHS family, proline/betaine transporter